MYTKLLYIRIYKIVNPSLTYVYTSTFREKTLAMQEKIAKTEPLQKKAKIFRFFVKLFHFFFKLPFDFLKKCDRMLL